MPTSSKIYDWYKELNIWQQFAFWYRLFEDEIHEIIIKDWIVGHQRNVEDLVNLFEEDEWNNIPELYESIDPLEIESLGNMYKRRREVR